MRRCALTGWHTRGVLLVAGVALAHAAPVHGQVRGLPVFFDPTYSYDTRLGIDVGHGGETDGLTVAASATHLFVMGNCKRLALNAAAGFLNPGGGGFDANLNLGGSASVLLNPCPSPLAVSNPTIRFFGGAGLVRVADENLASVPIGVGAGYMLEVAFARVVGWATPRAHYRERLSPSGSAWDFAFSLGLDIGAGAIAGLRLALDCCEGGVGGGYGFSLWF